MRHLNSSACTQPQAPAVHSNAEAYTNWLVENAGSPFSGCLDAIPEQIFTITTTTTTQHCVAHMAHFGTIAAGCARLRISRPLSSRAVQRECQNG
jgi:hypothetical protein